MNRRLAAALVASLSLAVVPATQAVGAGSSAAPPPERVNLPRGSQPEGITTDGESLFVGSLANGAIRRIDPVTGKKRTIAKGKDGRVAVGLDFDRRRNMLWVAGGDGSVVRVHDAVTGDVVRTYRFRELGARFLNDVVVTRRGAYITDSVNNRLLVVPLVGAGLPPRRAAKVVRLSGAIEHQRGQLNLNGIVASKGRLLAVQTSTGKLFRINPATGRTRLVRLGGYSLTNGDGLEIERELLYVVRNQDERIAVLRLAPRLKRARLLEEITDASFDVPSTAALIGRTLWVVSARFNHPDRENARYWVSRVQAYLRVPPR